MNIVDLGDEVQCKITGFKGVVTSYAKCLTGCDRITIQPNVKKDGKHPEALWFDVAAVTILKKQKVKSKNVQAENAKGGWPTKLKP